MGVCTLIEIIFIRRDSRCICIFNTIHVNSFAILLLQNHVIVTKILLQTQRVELLRQDKICYLSTLVNSSLNYNNDFDKDEYVRRGVYRASG